MGIDPIARLLARGVVAGVAGTAAMTAYQLLVQRISASASRARTTPSRPHRPSQRIGAVRPLRPKLLPWPSAPFGADR